MRLLLLTLPGAALVGSLVATLLARVSARRRFVQGPEAFRCRLRAPDGGVAGLRTGWRRASAHAQWVHDVLLVRRGPLGGRTLVLPVRRPAEQIRLATAGEVRELGPEPLVLGLTLDGGETVEVAVPVGARAQVVGPFLAAAIPGLPEAQAEPRTRTE